MEPDLHLTPELVAHHAQRIASAVERLGPPAVLGPQGCEALGDSALLDEFHRLNRGVARVAHDLAALAAVVEGAADTARRGEAAAAEALRRVER